MNAYEMNDFLSNVDGVIYTSPSDEYNSVFFEFENSEVSTQLTLVKERELYYITDGGYLSFRGYTPDGTDFFSLPANRMETIFILQKLDENTFLDAVHNFLDLIKLNSGKAVTFKG